MLLLPMRASLEETGKREKASVVLETGPLSLPWEGPLHSSQGHRAVMGSASEQK